MNGAGTKPLAILGGPPEFTEPRHVGRPNLGAWEHLERRLQQIWTTHRLTNDGPLVREFEALIQRQIGVAHAIAVCNATIGLELTFRALELTGEVIVPAFTFPATVHALAAVGLVPVFCDIDPRTHRLDPRQVEGQGKGTQGGVVVDHRAHGNGRIAHPTMPPAP